MRGFERRRGRVVEWRQMEIGQGENVGMEEEVAGLYRSWELGAGSCEWGERTFLPTPSRRDLRGKKPKL